MAPTSTSSHFGIYDELVSVLTLYHSLFTALEPKLSTKETSKRVLELANLIFIAHDIIGWGELSNIRRTLQVNCCMKITSDSRVFSSFYTMPRKRHSTTHVSLDFYSLH